jgi:hypothetical protein
MSCQMYEIDVRRNINGMRNGLSERRTTFNENLTEFVQKYVAVRYERNHKYLLLNRNNIALQIIVWQENFDCRRRNRDIDISPF